MNSISADLFPSIRTYQSNNEDDEEMAQKRILQIRRDCMQSVQKDSIVLSETELNGHVATLMDKEVARCPLKPLYDTYSRYAESQNKSERKVAIECTVRTLQVLHSEHLFGDILKVLDIFEERFGRDSDDEMRLLLLENMPAILREFLRTSSSASRAPQVFTEILARTVTRSVDHVRKCAIGAITVIFGEHDFPEETVKICTALLRLAILNREVHGFVADEVRLEAVTLLCHLVSYRRTEIQKWIYSDFAGPFSHLLQDTVFHIRKTCISILGNLAELFGFPVTEKFIVPFLLALSKDPIWGVRKACCEVFADVAEHCSLAAKEGVLAPCFVELLNDSSLWVRSVAHQQLGPFIATFANRKTHASGMLSHENKSHTGTYCCEFSSMPPSVCLPPRKEPAGDLDVMESLVNSWTPKQEYGLDRLHDFQDELDGSSGAAAICCTQDDLSKLDEDDFSEEEDKDFEELEEAIRLQTSSFPDEAKESYAECFYWSRGFPELNDEDLRSYAKSRSCASKLGESCVEDDRAGWVNMMSGQQPSPVISTERSADKGSIRNRSPHDQTGGNDSGSAACCRHQVVVPELLLKTYKQMVSSCAKQEGDINRHCAHNFPAVAFTLGRENWPELIETYMLLASNIQWRARQSLASSMHEVAAIIGEENTDRYLVPVFEQFMKDVEDVKLGILKHLCEFFKLVTARKRRELLKFVTNFLHSDGDSVKNWRFRYEYTRQCILLCDLYKVNDVNEHIAAIALTLATDRVAEVREAAACLLACILGRFITNDCRELHDERNSSDTSDQITCSFANEIIKGFAHSRNWRRRQTYVRVCCKVLEGKFFKPNQFGTLLLNDLLSLSNDVVPNVRIVVARCLSFSKEVEFSQEERDKIRQTLKKLSCDCDEDCQRIAKLALSFKVNKCIEIDYRAERLSRREEELFVKCRGEKSVSSAPESYA